MSVLEQTYTRRQVMDRAVVAIQEASRHQTVLVVNEEAKRLLHLHPNCPMSLEQLQSELTRLAGQHGVAIEFGVAAFRSSVFYVFQKTRRRRARHRGQHRNAEALSQISESPPMPRPVRARPLRPTIPAGLKSHERDGRDGIFKLT
jgi:hypothetical protein